MPVTNSPTTTPTTTPDTPVRTSPGEQPWQERFTDPWKICPQQVRELGSPDIEP